ARGHPPLLFDRGNPDPLRGRGQVPGGAAAGGAFQGQVRRGGRGRGAGAVRRRLGPGPGVQHPARDRGPLRRQQPRSPGAHQGRDGGGPAAASRSGTFPVGVGGGSMGGHLWVRGGTLVGEHGTWRADLLILDGRIAAVGDPAAWTGGLADLDVPVLDASGRHVLPGVIDVHVHFRDPGLTHKEDFLTGSAAAACGGVTTVLDMPNTVPPVNTAAALEQKRRAIEGRSYVDYGLYGAIT